MEINFYEKRKDKVPAFVTFIRGKDRAELNVERKIWTLAEMNYSLSRFILCHEIGHLKMHRNDALGFAKVGKSQLINMQPEELAEAQANRFADNMLVPTNMVELLHGVDFIARKFNVPRECAIRRLDDISYINIHCAPKSYAGDAYPECCNFTLIRIGTYCTCDRCGHKSGPF